MQLETPRLYLRRLTPADRPGLCAILQDPQVMYAYEHAFSSQEVDQWLEKQLERYAQDGLGLWAVLLKENGALIGQCGLTWQSIPGQTVLEVGYLFARAYWHRGFATEAAIGCRDYAFTHLPVTEIYSIIRDNNLPSQQVARRNGMSPVGTIVKHYYHVDMPHLLFRITRKEWRSLPH